MSLTHAEADLFVTTSKAAKLLGISQRTVHYWMDRGVIKAWKTAGGHCRIPMSSINQVLEKRQDELLEFDGPILTILLVEDDESLREVTREVVANWGFPVRLVVAENGFEGLIQAGLTKPDVIIADLMMPAMNGFQMIKSLKEAPDLNNPRIVVVTGMDAQQIAVNGGMPPDVQVLFKPAPYEQLKEIVLEVLRYHSRGKYVVQQMQGRKSRG